MLIPFDRYGANPQAFYTLKPFYTAIPKRSLRPRETRRDSSRRPLGTTFEPLTHHQQNVECRQLLLARIFARIFLEARTCSRAGTRGRSGPSVRNAKRCFGERLTLWPSARLYLSTQPCPNMEHSTAATTRTKLGRLSSLPTLGHSASL